MYPIYHKHAHCDIPIRYYPNSTVNAVREDYVLNHLSVQEIGRKYQIRKNHIKQMTEMCIPINEPKDIHLKARHRAVIHTKSKPAVSVGCSPDVTNGI